MPKCVDFYGAFNFHEFSLETGHHILKAKSLYRNTETREIGLKEVSKHYFHFQTSFRHWQESREAWPSENSPLAIFLQEKKTIPWSHHSHLAGQAMPRAHRRMSHSTGAPRKTAAPAARSVDRDPGRCPGMCGHSSPGVVVIRAEKNPLLMRSNLCLRKAWPPPARQRLAKGRSLPHRFRNGLLPRCLDPLDQLKIRILGRTPCSVPAGWWWWGEPHMGHYGWWPPRGCPEGHAEAQGTPRGPGDTPRPRSLLGTTCRHLPRRCSLLAAAVLPNPVAGGVKEPRQQLICLSHLLRRWSLLGASRLSVRAPGKRGAAERGWGRAGKPGWAAALAAAAPCPVCAARGLPQRKRNTRAAGE